MRALAALLCVPIVIACDVREVRESDCPVGERVPMPGRATPGVLVNAYYLQEESARAVRRGETPSIVLDEVLGEVASLGIPWVRTNAFNDDPAKIGSSAIQRAPGDLDEVSLIGLDHVLAESARQGVQLLLVLTNYWDDYGGVAQYVAWAGLPAPETGDPRFFTEASVQALYRAYVAALLDRVSTVDGIRYGDHPAVLGWELVNEPRGRGLDGEGVAMRAWVDAMAEHVHALAPDHLVGLGDEGFDTSDDGYDAPAWTRSRTDDVFDRGTSFRLNLASPHIDFGTVHLYPEAWRVPQRDLARAGAQWIASHVAIGRALGKPVIVEEFGLRSRGGEDLSLETRRHVYDAWMRCVDHTGGAGIGPWLFTYDARPSAWDPYSFALFEGTTLEDDVNQYVHLLAAWAKTWGE